MKKVIWHGEKIKQEYKMAVPKALGIVGAQGATFVKDKTPVITGLLKSSIAFATTLQAAEATKEGEKTAGIDELISPPNDSFHLKIGTAVHYAPHVEYGTVKMKRQSYLRLGVLSNRNVLGKLFAKSMKGLVK